jgi:hypothetical protein
MKKGKHSFTIRSNSSVNCSSSKTLMLSFLPMHHSRPTLHTLSGKMTMALIGPIWKLSPRERRLKRSQATMRTSLMMSDLLGACSIALLPFWCLDTKGGEVVLFRIFSVAFLGVVGRAQACHVFYLPCLYACVHLS